jgi:protein-tyrosine phosphatase
MDHTNLSNIKALAPAGGRASLSLLLDHLPGQAGRVVADPYYGNVADFEACWRQVDAAALQLAKSLY